MIPLSQNPTVVVLIGETGKVEVVATNIAPISELEIIVTKDLKKFEEQAKGKPFIQSGI